MLKIHTAANLPEAHLLLGLLRNAGIEAQVLNSYAQGASGEIPPDQAWPQIWLENPADAERALAIIRDYERRPSQTEWVFCPDCKERNPATFEICWNCGSELEE